MTVTTAAPEHTDAVVALLEEMDRFYGATEVEPLDVRRKQVELALFRDPPAAYALLAWDTNQLAGIASYSFLWPAVGLTRSLYLKELYVTDRCRRRGIGTELMGALFEVAAQHDCSRVEWTTDDDNFSAQRFYRDLGLTQHPKLFYRADYAAIAAALR